MKIGLVMNVKLLKNLVFLGLLSFSVFLSFAVSKIIPDGTIPYNMGVQSKAIPMARKIWIVYRN